MGCFSKDKGNKIRMILFLSLTVGYFLVELIVGQITNSMALVADAFHMLSDVVALIVAFTSMVISPRKWAKNTFGFARAEVLGALSNSVFLLALCFSIVVDSIKKFINPEEIQDPKLVLIVGATGLGLNLIGLILFSGGGHEHSHGGMSHGHSHGGRKHNHKHHHNHLSSESLTHGNKVQDLVTNQEKNGSVGNLDLGHSQKPRRGSSAQMNIRGVFLHVLGDALGSVVVIISALIEWLTDWEYKKYVDPSLSLVIVVIIVLSTIPLLKESSMVLMQNIPEDYDMEELKNNLMQAVPEILDIHELHLWRLVGNRLILTGHVSLKPEVDAADQMIIARSIKDFFHSQGIHSTTIQLESLMNLLPNESSDSNSDSYPPPYFQSCLLKCPTYMNSDTKSESLCDESLCCAPTPNKSDESSEKSITLSVESPVAIVDLETNMNTKM